MILAGVVFLDHTADVGIAVDAHSFEGIPHLAALGMMALLRGEDDEAKGEPVRSGVADTAGRGEPEAVPIRLHADTTAGLLADWLREILFLHEVSRLDYVGASFDRAEPGGVVASIHVAPGGRAVREIKGVTYHELVVEQRRDGGWRARVIFDV